ncbi:MAG: dihydropteroate synthase, partial [Candidatus Zixiibacteriota bacterium]
MVTAELGNVKVGDGWPVAVMGVINLGADSFYRGSIMGFKQAAARAEGMVNEGAAIVDVGAMATGPHARPISAELEVKKLTPVIKAIARELDITISVDTQRAEVAEAAIEAGASVINDVSGLKADPRMAETIANHGCSAILMATERAPGDVYEVDEIRRVLVKSLEICKNHRVPFKKVVLDPAVGYWPARLKRLGQKAWGRPKGVGYPYAAFLD